MKECFETLAVKRKIDFFISYKWNEISEDEANRLCKQLALYQINPIRDKYNLEYGDSIVSFMNSLKECDGVILIICEEYFLGIQSFLGSLLFRVFRSGSSVGSFSRVWF